MIHTHTSQGCGDPHAEAGGTVKKAAVSSDEDEAQSASSNDVPWCPTYTPTAQQGSELAAMAVNEDNIGVGAIRHVEDPRRVATDATAPILFFPIVAVGVPGVAEFNRSVRNLLAFRVVRLAGAASNRTCRV